MQRLYSALAKGYCVGTLPPPSGPVPKLFVRVSKPTDIMNANPAPVKVDGVFALRGALQPQAIFDL